MSNFDVIKLVKIEEMQINVLNFCVFTKIKSPNRCRWQTYCVEFLPEIKQWS